MIFIDVLVDAAARVEIAIFLTWWLAIYSQSFCNFTYMSDMPTGI